MSDTHTALHDPHGLADAASPGAGVPAPGSAAMAR